MSALPHHIRARVPSFLRSLRPTIGLGSLRGSHFNTTRSALVYARSFGREKHGLFTRRSFSFSHVTFLPFQTTNMLEHNYTPFSKLLGCLYCTLLLRRLCFVSAGQITPLAERKWLLDKAEQLLAYISPRIILPGKEAFLLATRYTADALIDEPLLPPQFTKVIYPAVAANLHCSLGAAEKAIYHAASVCWMEGRNDRLNNIIGQQLCMARPIVLPLPICSGMILVVAIVNTPFTKNAGALRAPRFHFNAESLSTMLPAADSKRACSSRIPSRSASYNLPVSWTRRVN